MRIDPLHYVDWVVWAGATYARLPAIDRDRFTHELLAVMQAASAPFADLPHGSGLGLVVALAAWQRKHPDPLLPLRSAMDAMKLRWSTNAKGAPGEGSTRHAARGT
jgi:hypothetical protein